MCLCEAICPRLFGCSPELELLGRDTGETRSTMSVGLVPSFQRIIGTEAAAGTVSGCWLVEGRVCAYAGVQYACAAVPVCMALSVVHAPISDCMPLYSLLISLDFLDETSRRKVSRRKVSYFLFTIVLTCLIILFDRTLLVYTCFSFNNTCLSFHDTCLLI